MAHAGILLAVAGSDPSGGAGIQADLKTACALGVYGAAAVTCITVQDTTGVRAVHCLDPGVVAAQVRTVVDDLPVRHIKTGMIGNGGIAAALGPILARFPGQVVVDPVLAASTGAPLLPEADLAAFFRHVATAATVLTPNRRELEILSDRRCTSDQEIQAAADHLFARLPRLQALVVTGGHFTPDSSQVTDRLYLRTGPRTGILSHQARHPRLPAAVGHGTGCTLATAYACCHLRFGDHRAALARASGLVHRLLAVSPAMGRGQGPLHHHLARDLPRPG